MLKISHLCARAGDFTLTDINLTLDTGKCHAILGPSGSGKSTLLRAILGMQPMLSGNIHLANQDITTLPVEQRLLGYVPQHLGLFPHLSVLDNLLYSARARRIPASQYQPLLKRLIETTDIRALLERRPATLSGGERQRVALVRALVPNPPLVLLDEPFTALNESLRRELWWLVKALQQEYHLTVLLVTHDLAEAHILAEDITILINGCQAQTGNKTAVYYRPNSEAVARFLGLKNLFPAQIITQCRVECPALGGIIHIENNTIEHGAVWLAIRAEQVALRHLHDQPHPGEIYLTGHFEAVLDFGEMALLHFRTRAGTQLETRCGSRVLKKFGIKPGYSGVVGLSANDLFTIPKIALLQADSPS